VGYVDEFNLERADLDDIASGNLMEVGLLGEVVFIETALYERKGERCAINGQREFRDQEGNAADVVFVAVGEHEAADVFPVGVKKLEIRRNDVYTEHLVFGKHHAGIDHQNVVSVAQCGAIHSELTEPTEGYYL
jgi:hypothetical protein